jgi:hypothetical protein
MTAQEFTLETAGRLPPPVPDDQPPPEGMPLELVVLDSLADDVETIYTMRNCGAIEPHGLALVGEAHIREALRRLLAEGLIEVATEYAIVDRQIRNHPIEGEPLTGDDDLRHYWFGLTPAGRAALEAGGDELDLFYDAHPIRDREGIVDRSAGRGLAPTDLLFMPDYSADPIWEVASECMIGLELLPITDQTRATIRAWASRWEQLAWQQIDADIQDHAEAAEAEPIRPEAREAIERDGRALCQQLRNELGPPWRVGWVTFQNDQRHVQWEADGPVTLFLPGAGVTDEEF